MTRPANGNGDKQCDVCSEHSGFRVMIYSIGVGIVINLVMQGYNTFIQNGEIQSRMARIEQKLVALDEKDKSLDSSIMRIEARVDQIERGVKK